jgi:hypothetical protein
MDKFVDYIIFIGGFLIFLGFLKIFRGIYIGYLIDRGTFRDKELDEFPLPCINEDDYENIIERLITFVSQIDNNTECCLTLNISDINCLVCNGLIPVKPYHLKSKNGLLFYYFELNRLFKKEMSYAGPDGVYYGINEILLSRKIPYATSDRFFTETEIFVREDFVYPDPPANKLEEWLREKESKLIRVRGNFICKSLFVRSLFNSDLNLAEEEIIAALKKVTSLEIVNNQLIFQANREVRELL